MGNYEDANRLAVLSGAEDLDWQEQVVYTGAPTSNSLGISVLGAQVAVVSVKLRKEDVSKRTTYVQLVYDVATTYTIDIDGNANTSVGAGSELLALTELRDNINADIPGAGDLVTASLADLDGDGTEDAVKLVGIGEDDYALTISVAGGAGTIFGSECDPTSGAARLFSRRNGITSTSIPPTWNSVPLDLAKDPAWDSLDYRGIEENFNTGGMERLYVELYDLAGLADVGTITYTARVDIAPGIIP